MQCTLSLLVIIVGVCLTGAHAGTLGPANYEVAGRTYSGDGTYYAQSPMPRGSGHCSFSQNGFGTAPAYQGFPLAINTAQYTGTSVCGLCVQYRGTGSGSGGNPVSSSWQRGFICDECPECAFGDLDQQAAGDGRWKIEWYPVQCPVGSSTFKYGFQGGNPWYRKIQVANGRVPVVKVEIMASGDWQACSPTIDNFHEFHGDINSAWNGDCARVRLTSVLGDTVEDRLCCKDGVCNGDAQFPCSDKMPGCSQADSGDFSAQRRPLRRAAAKPKATQQKKAAQQKKQQQQKKKQG